MLKCFHNEKKIADDVAKAAEVSTQMQKIFTDSFAAYNNARFDNNCNYNDGKTNTNLPVGYMEALPAMQKSIISMLKKHNYSSNYKCNNQNDQKHAEHNLARGGTACTVTLFQSKKN
ncbi:hypothetical protein PRIPAC_86080 [Pristionchus pacificus]|uniref:Uncharacterized protein n=1 Tax=Pristionchus pacificus TaxID=54126 RepID=A0A2A6BMI4_PRIPA|nr:hypothetical protein PRIPAC_86080 [Pristionchus pacificus]|eukprot:PDM67016.1 hypothetical protein PRIPAC_48433 [Pristionchus pacificus]